ncbi:MAG: hypothetical protein IKJ63_10810 [Clostridia bacterium]|nr:hypothetical protein [Clostridia bacterium]MBR3955950.1 hypothetical protein [Clostridia bacterium]
MSKKNSVFLCPYCRRPISKNLFNYKHALKNVQKAVEHGRKERKADVGETLTPAEVCTAVRAPSYPKELGWVIWRNEVAEERRSIFANADRLVKSAGVQPPVNLPSEAAWNTCYVLNDFWYWCLNRVYSVDLHKNAPRMELEVDAEKQTCRIFCYDPAFDTVGSVLATNADPVCPYADCNKILSCAALEITDEPIEIALIGDPNTGKTVWQVSLAAFLEMRGRCGLGKQYEIAPRKNLILPETIGWRTKLRAEAFLEGKLPSQTPASAVGGFVNHNGFGGMTSDDYGDYGTITKQALRDDNRAEDLVLILREENAQGKMKSCRFVRIFDFSGENSEKGMHGYDDLGILRNCEAMFFFADILTREGLIAINKFVEDSQNIALPYFAMMFPKIDLAQFDLQLFRSCCRNFEEALIRVLAYRLRFELHSLPQNLRTFAKIFLRNYLHCSPESLGMFLCNHYESKMRALFVDENGEDDINTLFSFITDDPAFCAVFEAKDAKQWVTDLCNEHIYLTESAKSRAGRPDEQLRRLYINFYLRNLLRDAVNTETAQKNADDIGLFPFSALGADNGLDQDTLRFDIDTWKPINLFDPLVWLLKEDSHA